MRAARRSRSIAPVVVAGVFASIIGFVSGCPFDDAPPAGAVILCVVDADCPKAQSCDGDAHECVLPGELLDNAARSSSRCASIHPPRRTASSTSSSPPTSRG